MRKCVRVSPSLCSTHVLEIGNLVEVHELGVGEELSRNVYFILAELLYNVQSDRKHGHRSMIYSVRTI